jgi:NADPH:quinone reductase-like Zn-dependent oxidoreductase
MTKAVQISAFGGPQVMSIVDLPFGKPGPGEALVHHHAVGLNYIDVYFPKRGLPCRVFANRAWHGGGSRGRGRGQGC